MEKEEYSCDPGLNMEFLWFNFKIFLWQKLLLGLLLGIVMSIQDYFDNCHEFYLVNIISSIIGVNIIWSGSSFIGGYIENRFSWEEGGLKKSFYLILLNIVYITIILGLELYIIGLIEGKPVPAKYYFTSFLFAFMVSTIVNLIFIARSIFIFWKHTKYENEVLKQENLRSQLESLKNQVNPHFLFNSLNTLISIIDDDPETAKNYTQNLSQVYRYILQAKEKDLVTLKEELDFTKAYDYLLKIRYGNNLHFHLEIAEKYLHRMTPTLVLQMLVENAIKHNVISESKPLTIRIFIDQNENLVVSNNYQPKKLNIESDKVGLKNIADRFRILEDKEIEIIQNEADFIVKLPLINR